MMPVVVGRSKIQSEIVRNVKNQLRKNPDNIVLDLYGNILHIKQEQENIANCDIKQHKLIIAGCFANLVSLAIFDATIRMIIKRKRPSLTLSLEQSQSLSMSAIWEAKLLGCPIFLRDDLPGILTEIAKEVKLIEKIQ